MVHVTTRPPVENQTGENRHEVSANGNVEKAEGCGEHHGDADPGFEENRGNQGLATAWQVCFRSDYWVSSCDRPGKGE